MHYYEVLVSAMNYHGQEALTYSSELPLAIGMVVAVPLQRKNEVLGMVTAMVEKPSFKTKPLTRAISSAPLPVEQVKLLTWLRAYYPAPLGQLTSLFLPATLLQTSRPTPPKTTKIPEAQPLPPLTKEQQIAITAIQTAITPVLLHGNTGSGKTRVYQELAAQVTAAGQSVMILTPEIGLTPQIARSFEETFPGHVTIMHSNLTPAARRKAWQHILAQQAPHIVIGPRSALFTPLHNIGLIVIDEAHDQAYKQEQTPYYQASRVAAKLAELHHAQLVLGTATPPITDYYTFYEKKLPIIPMTSSAIESIHAEPSIVIVDQKDRGLFTRSPWLSTPLIAAIEENINSGEQSLIFLNRRGTARVVLCQACGWQALCPRCDLPLTYHGDTHLLQCHTCGFHQPAFSGCPDCDSPEIIFKSIGTKSLIDELHRLFPDARLLRLDSDNTKSESLGSNYGSIHSGEVDIIVGTQMIAKGLDLPLLNLVGIVAADTSLSFPDYTSEERTYQLISQVKGRVGRGHRAGRIILQTYQPESPTLATALRSDYLAFYQTQLLERKQFGFPPFYFMLKLTCDRASSRSAQKAAEDLAAQLRKTVSGIEIIGPSPSYSEKRNNRYYWQLIIKAKQRAHLIEVIHHLPANWSYDIDPSHLL